VRRRKSLALLAVGAPQALAASCAPATPPDRRLRVGRERLQAEGRIEAEYARDPIELREAPEGPVGDR
jgi:hypothetical protein